MLINDLPEFIREIAAQRYFEQHKVPHCERTTVMSFTWSQTPEATCAGGSAHVWAHVDSGRFDDFPGYKESLKPKETKEEPKEVTHNSKFMKGDRVVCTRLPSHDDWKGIGEIPLTFSIGSTATIYDVTGNGGIQLNNVHSGWFPPQCFSLIPVEDKITFPTFPRWMKFSDSLYEYIVERDEEMYKYSYRVNGGIAEDLHTLVVSKLGSQLRELSAADTDKLTSLGVYPHPPEKGIEPKPSSKFDGLPKWMSIPHIDRLEYVTEVDEERNKYKYSHYARRRGEKELTTLHTPVESDCLSALEVLDSAGARRLLDLGIDPYKHPTLSSIPSSIGKVDLTSSDDKILLSESKPFYGISAPKWYRFGDHLFEYVVEVLPDSSYKYSHSILRETNPVLRSHKNFPRCYEPRRLNTLSGEDVQFLSDKGLWPHPPPYTSESTPFQSKPFTPQEEFIIPQFKQGDTVRCVKRPTLTDFKIVGYTGSAQPTVVVEQGLLYEVHSCTKGRLSVLKDGKDLGYWHPSTCFELWPVVKKEIGLPELFKEDKNSSLCTNLPSMEPIKIKILSLKTPHI